MREMVNRFLDEYCQEEIVCVYEAEMYRLVSGKVVLISFTIHGENQRFLIYSSYEICNSVQSMFNLTKNESIQYVKDWIGDKLSLKRVSDLMRLIPT